MRRIRLVVALALIVGVLAACSGQLTIYIPSPNYSTVTATSGRQGAVAQRTFQPGDVYWYRVNVSSQSPSLAVYFELDQNLNMSVYESDGTSYAGSSSPTYFATGSLALAALNVGPQAIQPGVACAGSCVLHSADSSRFWVKIENQTSSAATVNLYAYTKPFQDTAEPQNNALSGAVLLSQPADAGGALETINDVDYFEMSTPGSLTLTGCGLGPSPTIDVVASVYDSQGALVATLHPNDPAFSAFAGDYAVVHSQSGDYAAPASTCIYYMSLQ